MSNEPPVVIEPYNPAWPSMFLAERELLMRVLGPWLTGAIEHVGSTAIPGMPAKPVRDRLRADPQLEKEYADLKVALAQRHRDDREAYTEAKGPFVERVLRA